MTEWRMRWRQGWTIARMELRRAFFSRRSFWVYGLAFLPAFIFLIYGLSMHWQAARLSAAGLVDPVAMSAVNEGDKLDATVARLGAAAQDDSWSLHETPPGRMKQPIKYRNLTYFDGRRQYYLRFTNDLLTEKRSRLLVDFQENREIFATMFQLFYLQLGIFFGCLGIFMNLLRGEALDRTLHFWLLLPIRREVLLLGKYGAGLLAAVVIFTGGALAAFFIMLQAHPAQEIELWWARSGFYQAGWYAAAAALGCLAYGSVFMAAGVVLRNPIIPAAALLAWESISRFLPELLQRASVIYYLQSLCPLPVMDNDSALWRLLVQPATPATHSSAIAGLSVIMALMLTLACLAIRRMQISYGAEP